MAILLIYDASKDPPTFSECLHRTTVEDAVRMADDLVQSSPKELYSVYDNAGTLKYQR